MLIDIHVHCAKPRHRLIARSNGTRYPDPAELVKMLDDAGIDKACVLSGVSPETKFTLVPPEEVLEIRAQYPERFIPFCNLDPRFLTNSAQADFGPLLTAYKELGCKGVGEFAANLPFDDPLCMNLFKHVEASGLPLTFHIAVKIGGTYGVMDELGLPRLERVLQAFPKLKFLAHSQAFWAEIGTNLVENGQRLGYPTGKVTPGRAVELMRRYPNLFGDLSAGSGFGAISRDPEFGYAFMEEFQDRLLFGTDIANVPQHMPIVEYFRRLEADRKISEETYEKIAWRNANRLLDLGLE